MPRYITLKLVNEQGTPHPWPGTDAQFEIGSELSATPVWIGVSADGLSNQIYPITDEPAAILGGWPRLYQGVQLNIAAPGDDSPLEVGPGEYVYYLSLEEFERLVAACCVAQQVDESPQESPSESPGGPETLQFRFGNVVADTCSADPEELYLEVGADPDSATGAGIFYDEARTQPVNDLGDVPYVVINGNLYHFDFETGTVGAFMWPCSENFAIRFAPDLPNPGTEVAFWLVVPSGDPYEMFVDWGDGSPEEQYNGFDELPGHTYAAAGQYMVRIRFTVNPTIIQNFELLNTPMTEFTMHPDFAGALSMTTLHLANNALTDAALANFNIPDSVNTVILENNQLSNAIFAHLETSNLTTLNLNQNPINSVAGVTLPQSVSALYMQLTGLTAFDPIHGVAQMTDVQLQNNSLTSFSLDDFDLFILTNLILNGNNLPSADVDAVLQDLDAAGLENGLVNLLGQTPAAPPGAGGLTAQSNLEGKGWTVMVDS